MDKKKIEKILQERLEGEKIKKMEDILKEENMQKRKKIELLKKLIKEGKYQVPAEEVAEKILKFIENEYEN